MSSKKNNIENWLDEQIKKVSNYIPWKGGYCDECKIFCKTFKTDAETGVRWHKCPICGKTFKTAIKKNIPTQIDTMQQKHVEVDKSKFKKSVQRKRK